MHRKSNYGFFAPLALCIGLLTGCATASGERPGAGAQATIEGTIASIDTKPLAVGMRVRATGDANADGDLVVCKEATHHLTPVE